MAKLRNDDALKPGAWVRLREAQMGRAHGFSKRHCDGESWEAPAGSFCEVWDVDSTTGWITVLCELSGGKLTPHSVEVIVGEDDVEPAAKPKRPGIGDQMPLPPPGLEDAIRRAREQQPGD
jgi:hypothetical protein